MYKRLTISLVLMGLAAFSLAAGAVAWFADSGSAEVSISAGSADLVFEVRSECSGPWDGPYDFDTPADFDRWQGIVPGDDTADCYRITNSGNGDLQVYVKHSTFEGSSAFLNDVEFRYQRQNADGSYSTKCLPAPGWANADGTRFTDDRGCDLGLLEEGDRMIIRGEARFLDDGNQDGLETLDFSYLSTITGYTG